uniref:Fatty acid 2-hydroxylase n=1 Tax=Timspurckia oligopyrenoides TaxID=708627 RepID=A0A7S1EPR9_9RHOD|mmetsp:Transcript_11091/g.20055  ORF Transcript_11091/g.20055 Transcript_11091/m.20055 type:complete len:336 (+) Transcript_11091:44-1051(+)|eukprot:CAMPEP_0182450742 /NCGR_PEP_ID=MMETSP1172-20130603/43342_1 /TAXON_ID=708627 /ORGANISM="Timspurckia oligopyrenoides, Strain CCMP3278" /LENGTH=335 /DNA_ID=CAMNT_0024648461 /DNA_START=50 /DNA_END=1057 /DNA_ORIENTATION=-
MTKSGGKDVGYKLSMRVVSHHNTVQDAWVVMDGKVFDITMFLDNHPGGKDIIVPHLGSDVTEVMKSGPHKHSSFAYKMLASNQIGSLHSETPESTKEQNELDSLVNWNEPLLPQIGRMGDKYDTWVHSFPTTDHTVKMFQSDTLEFLTKCPWYMPLLFWIPIAIAILFQYFKHVTFDAPRFSSLALGGFVFWLFFEYSLHRWGFHAKSSTYWGNIIHFLIHGHHHITPMDDNRVVFPPVPALLFASPIWIGVLYLLGYADGYAFLLGFLIGYLNYDMTHFWIHQRVPKSPYIQWHKSRHVYHHYHAPSGNFGISHPLFDYVFGTFVADGTGNKAN